MLVPGWPSSGGRLPFWIVVPGERRKGGQHPIWACFIYHFTSSAPLALLFLFNWKLERAWANCVLLFPRKRLDGCRRFVGQMIREPMMASLRPTTAQGRRGKPGTTPTSPTSPTLPLRSNLLANSGLRATAQIFISHCGSLSHSFSLFERESPSLPYDLPSE